MQRVETAHAMTEANGLADLYERHAPAAGRLAYLLTGDRALAEDLVQEAFVRVVGRFRHLRVPDAFEAYLPGRSSTCIPRFCGGGALSARTSSVKAAPLVPARR